MNKKAQTLSMNTIVIAIIAALVLVILIMVMSGNIRIFNDSTGDCESKQISGNSAECTQDCPSGFITIPGTNCESPKVCCVNPVRSETSDSS